MAGTAPPQGKFVYFQYSGSAHADWLLPLASEQGIWAARIAQELTDPSRRFGVAHIKQFQDGLSHPLRPPGIGSQNAGKGLGEDATQAQEVVTEEFSGVNHQLNRQELQGRSEARRRYRLWTRELLTPYGGQGADCRRTSK